MRLVLDSWLAAIVAFTRIPIARRLPASAFPYAVWYLPLLGWCYGGLQLLIGGGSSLSNLLLLSLPIVISGALHEDGLGDFSDAILGASERTRRLEIMKDPRLGSYGVLALIGTLACQFLSLESIAVEKLTAALIVSQVAARGLATSLVARLSYVERSGSRAHAYIPPLPPLAGLLLSAVTTLAVGFLLPSAGVCLILLLALVIWHELWVRGLRRAFGGYTGDCLGAAIKLSETLLLLSASWLWPRIGA